MPVSTQSTVARLLYPDAQAVDFARVVAELDGVLTRLNKRDVVVTWDCDDLVTFDLPQTRALLAWSETGRRGAGGCLTVSVGPGPAPAPRAAKPDFEVLCSRLVERIEERFVPAAILWAQIEGRVKAEGVDGLFVDLTGPDAQGLPPVDSILDRMAEADLHMADLHVAGKLAEPNPRLFHADELSRLAMDPALLAPRQGRPNANLIAAWQPGARVRPLILVPAAMMGQVSQPLAATSDDPHREMSAELLPIRTALYPLGGEEPIVEAPFAYSTPMRLAAHCMNATLILVWPPLGAAVMTYSVLGGENMRLSGRLMAVTGTLVALAQTPLGQTVAAVAKSLV